MVILFSQSNWPFSSSVLARDSFPSSELPFCVSYYTGGLSGLPLFYGYSYHVYGNRFQIGSSFDEDSPD